MDNYQMSRDRAQNYFSGFDQSELIRAWGLEHDDDWLYTALFGREYAICRKTGVVMRRWNGEQARHGETLSIFDLLCHAGSGKTLSGEYAPVNSLNGRTAAVGVGTDFHAGAAARFDADPEGFQRACLALGGTPVEMGDLGFRFPVFGKMEMILKFYHADEDFSSSVTLLWDRNTLQFVFYETVFYLAGCLLGAIEEKM